MTNPARVRKGAIEGPAASPPRDEEYDLRDLFKILRRQMAVIIVTVLVVTISVGLIALNLTARYTASSTIVVEPRETHIISFDETQQDVPEDVSTINTHVKFLTSNSFAKKVIERLDLVQDPEFNSALRGDPPGEPHPVLSRVLSWAEMPLVAIGLASQRSSQTHDQLRSGAFGNAEEFAPAAASLAHGSAAHAAASAQDDGSDSTAMAEDHAPDALLEKATEAFLGKLEVDPSGQSYAITVSFTSVNPETAARVANAMAELYLEQQLEAKQAATTRALDWLDHRLDMHREHLVQSERAVGVYRAKHELVVSDDGLEFSDEELAALTQELIAVHAERVAREARLNRIRQVRGSREKVESIPEVMMSPIISELRQQELEVLRAEAQLRQEYGPRHPTIIQIQAEKDKIAARIDAEIRNIIASIANEVATIKVHEQTLQESLARAEAASAADSQAEIQLRILEGEVESTRTLYTMLLDRFKELTAERELLEPGVQVISTAAVPTTPSAPQVKLIAGAGFMGSLMFGTLLALVFDRLDRGLRTGRQAEEVLDVPHIGLIPRLGGLMNGYGAYRYLVEKPTSAYAEAIRGVQTALCFSKVDQPSQVVLVTSSVPGEGKTTLALSLATLLAQSGCRTVAVDLDLRRPSLGRPARDEGGGDLVDHLRGEKRLDDILLGAKQLHTLDIVPCRRPAGSPTDLLASQRMDSFMAELRARYDYIILDSPPLLGMSDAQFAARLADAVLFVVRWSKTGEEVARKALDTLRNSGAPIAGVVLTQVDVRRHRMYSPEDVLQYYGEYRKYYVG